MSTRYNGASNRSTASRAPSPDCDASMPPAHNAHFLLRFRRRISLSCCGDIDAEMRVEPRAKIVRRIVHGNADVLFRTNEQRFEAQ
jgi:hypothetical protein